MYNWSYLRLNDKDEVKALVRKQEGGVYLCRDDRGNEMSEGVTGVTGVTGVMGVTGPMGGVAGEEERGEGEDFFVDY